MQSKVDMKKCISTFWCICFSSFLLAQRTIDSITVWHAELTTPGGALPFVFDMGTAPDPVTGGIVYTIHNGVEQLSNNMIQVGDTLQFGNAVFNTVIYAAYNKQKDTLRGYWQDYSRPSKYTLPFIAIKNAGYRFSRSPKEPVADISGKWTAIFDPETDPDTTIGLFTQTGNHLSGTFMTTAGDHRFLEGEVDGNVFRLSAFDGSHAFLFTGKISEDGTLHGDFWSGIHYHAAFVAERNDDAQMPDPTQLTYLKPGYTDFTFSLPDENGNMVSPGDPAFAGKVLIIEITGSWCPNCKDETSYLHDLLERYTGKDIAVIALQFERQTDPEPFKKNMEKLRGYFGITYPMLNAGLPKDAATTLPMLDRVKSYPTTIVLDKEHRVAQIYTGFSGPATGAAFLDFRVQFEGMLDTLLAR